MSAAYADLVAHLAAQLPDLQVIQPQVIDLPACKQQDAARLFELLKPVFPPLADGGVYRVYPLTAQQTAAERPLPDCVYGVLRSDQRTFAHAAVATVISFLLEIRAAAYADLIAQEDAVRTLLNREVGVEAVDASDDYEPETATYLSQLNVELSTAVADIVVLEAQWKPIGEALLCGNYRPQQLINYTVLTVQSDHAALLTVRDAVRDALSGWQAGESYTLLQHDGGEAVAVDCSLFAWADTFTHTYNRG